jgi:hypothetical protein
VLPRLLSAVDEADQKKAGLDPGHDKRPPFASPIHWAAFAATGLAYPVPLAQSGAATRS